jgi:hypothetical protein
VFLFVLGGAFLLLMASLVVGSLATPELPAYTPTPATPAPRPVGDSLVGPLTYTIDASAPDRWRRFHFGRASVVDSGPWDVAFRRNHVAAAPGAAIADLGPVPFDSVAELPAAGYVAAAGGRDSLHPAIGKWYDYNYVTHLLRSRAHVYAVRTADGRYAKLEILTYYCAGVGTGCVTFRFAYQGDGSRRVAPEARAPGGGRGLEGQSARGGLTSAEGS